MATSLFIQPAALLRRAALFFFVIALLFTVGVPLSAQQTEQVPASEPPPAAQQAPAEQAPSPQPPPVNWLVIPVRDLSGEGPSGIEEATTQALTDKLAAFDSWKASVNDSQAEVVKNAIREGMITEEEAASVPDLASAQRLGLVWGADTVLIGLLVRRDHSIVLLLNEIGTIGRQSAGPGKALDIPSPQVEVTEGASVEDLAKGLTEGVVERLLPLLQANRGLWAKDAEFAPAWEAEGDAYMTDGRYREARMAYAAALAVNPSSGVYHRKQAQSLLAQGDAEKARRQLEEARALLPKDGEVLLALGEVFLALGNPGRAAGEFEAAAFFAKDDLRPKEGLARANLARGNISAALKTYEELLRQAPQDLALHLGYGQALIAAKRPDKAAAEFNLCLQLDPENADARQALAGLLFQQGKRSEAIEQLRLLTDSTQAPLVYSLSSYQELMRSLSQEFEGLVGQFDQRLSQYWEDSISSGQFTEATEILNQRSDNLARLMERIAPPSELDRSHRYWVLAAALLNHSDFEAYRYAQDEGQEYLRRAQLFRQAAREAADEARNFANLTPPAGTPGPFLAP